MKHSGARDRLRGSSPRSAPSSAAPPIPSPARASSRWSAQDQEIQIGQGRLPGGARRSTAPTSDATLAALRRQHRAQRSRSVSHLPDLEWHFTVLDDPDVNAFAMPGGYIYITRGILAHLNSEAQLAGVLGHEIGHVTARHTAAAHHPAAARRAGARRWRRVFSRTFRRYSAGGAAGARPHVPQVRARRRERRPTSSASTTPPRPAATRARFPTTYAMLRARRRARRPAAAGVPVDPSRSRAIARCAPRELAQGRGGRQDRARDPQRELPAARWTAWCSATIRARATSRARRFYPPRSSRSR